jgi:hypothetical protein
MHLRAYFDQPLEFSKYLAAERLIADNTELALIFHGVMAAAE